MKTLSHLSFSGLVAPALLFVAFSFSSLPASAASAPDSSDYVLDAVSVVSFYRPDLKTGNLLTRDRLVEMNKGQEPSFILNSMPSVFAYSDTGNEYGYSYFRLRGMDQTRVNMTLDGMPLNEGEDMGVYFSNYPDMLASMHSVQVENGAGITNNGVAAYAGSINFESVDLLRDTVSRAYAGYGSFNTFKTSVEYNTGRLGKFAGHFKATQQQSDGFRDHAYNNSQSAFIKLGYFFSPDHTLDILSFVGQSRNGQGWIGSSAQELEMNPSANGCSEAETDRFIQNITKLQYRGVFGGGALVLTASAYYNFLKGHYYFDVDNYMVKVADPLWSPTGEVDCYNLRHNMYGGNVAVRAHLGGFRLTGGINASFFDRNHIGTSNFTESLLWDNTGHKNDVNVFARGEYSFRGFTAGADVQYRHADFAYEGDMPFDRRNWDFFNWSAKLRWSPDTRHSVYFSSTQTHREPTRSDMFGGEENLTAVVTDQAESVLDFELGYNIDLKWISGNLNLYYMDFRDELILNGAMGTNGLPIRVNAAKSFRTGAELSLVCVPVKGLELVNSTSWSLGRVNTAEEILTHVMSPSWLVNQDVSYSFSGVTAGVGMKYRSRMYMDLTNFYSLEGAVRFNAFVRWSIRGFTLGFRLNNIFNQRSFSNGMLGAEGPLYFIDAPRNFFVDVAWEF